jgi:hypothetical protein
MAAIGVHTLALASLPLIVTPDGQQYLTQAALYLGHQVPGQTFRYGATGGVVDALTTGSGAVRCSCLPWTELWNTGGATAGPTLRAARLWSYIRASRP